MKKITTLVVAMAGLAFGGQANAHVGYRDLSVANPFQRSLTSNIGWADAAEANWGDSHHAAWFSFTLATDSIVSIEAKALAAGTYPTLGTNGLQTTSASNPTGTYTAVTLDDIAFSLYKGLFNAPGGAAYENAYHYAIPGDTTSAHVLWHDFSLDNKEGGWNANGDSTLWNDAGNAKTINFVAAVNNLTNGTEQLLNVFLTAGSYSIAVGGAVLPSDALADHGSKHAVQAQLLSVQPVPVPGAAWLFGSAIAGMIGFNRRKQIAA